MKAMQIASLAAVMAGAAVGVASPASADELDGNYTMTSGSVATHVTFTPCGPDCRQRVTEQSGVSRRFHRQGNTWVTDDGMDSVTTIYMDTMKVVTVFPGDSTPSLTQQLIKDG